jgi:formiminoglutamate deiminase
VGGTFWTWREQMYRVAERLDPDRYLTLATAAFAEMALAGFTSVGEFHYLHHGPRGEAYDDPNAMGEALIEAARRAGVRIALLDTCYLAGGIGEPLEGVQLRFGDGDVAAWAARAGDLAERHRGADDVVVGAAVHSVRAVPREAIPEVAEWAALAGAPLHAHVSEQPAENAACRAAHGLTPTGLLAEAGALGPRFTAVHATHLSLNDLALLGESESAACLCPTTERDLADGIGPARALLDAGVRLTLGTDSHAIVDGFEEARAVELNLRTTNGRRGQIDAGELLAALTSEGHTALGFADAGRIEVGARADLVAVRMDSVRTAGGAEEALDTAVFAATASDVTDVIAGGREVVRDGRHVLGDVGRLLTDAIGDLHAAPGGRPERTPS